MNFSLKKEECENYPLFRLIFLLISSYIIMHRRRTNSKNMILY